jgi:hypothetical protein
MSWDIFLGPFTHDVLARDVLVIPEALTKTDV